MPAEENKLIVRRFFDELWNQRKLNVADEIFDPHCVSHQLQSGAEDIGLPRDAEAVKKHINAWLEGFPDLYFTIDRMFAEDECVITSAVMRGTHTGTWQGLPPTGRSLSIKMVVTHQIRNRKIIADWVLVESLGFFQQLGLVPAIEKILQSN
jgi:predicted ester cyclase